MPDLYKSIEFRLMSTAIRRKFPFIKKVELDEKESQNYKMFFWKLYVSVDDYKSWAADKFNIEPVLSSRVNKHMEDKKPLSFINYLFLNIDGDELDFINDEIEKILHSYEKTPTIPDDVRLRHYTFPVEAISYYLI